MTERAMGLRERFQNIGSTASTSHFASILSSFFYVSQLFLMACEFLQYDPNKSHFLVYLVNVYLIKMDFWVSEDLR